MTTEEALLIVAFAVGGYLAGTLVGHWFSWVLPAMLDELLDRPRRVAEQAKRDAEVKAATADDPFCSCPECGHLGSHHITHSRTVRPYGPGEFIPWQASKPGTAFADRSCTVCFHEWSTRHVPT